MEFPSSGGSSSPQETHMYISEDQALNLIRAVEHYAGDRGQTGV
jgi:hypothetical protein